jgi:hypothetical protein
MQHHAALPSGHAGVASCSFSSDRGTFTALADGSTTMMDAITTGQMVRQVSVVVM